MGRHEALNADLNRLKSQYQVKCDQLAHIQIESNYTPSLAAIFRCT
jgi:hypothetical protein